MAVSVIETANAASAANATTYNFGSQAIGTAASNRTVVVVVTAATAGGTIDVSSVTIGGNSATKVVDSSAVSGSDSVAADIWAIALAAGTTATVSVGLSITARNCAITVYSVIGAAAVVPTLIDDDTGDPVSLSFDAPAGSAVIGVAGSRGTTSFSGWTWTGLTEAHDQNVEGGDTFTTAASTFASAQTVSATADSDGTANIVCGCMACWIPHILAADKASFTLSGQNVSPLAARKITADAAVYIYTAQDVELVPNISDPILDAAAAAYTLTAQDVLFGRTTRIPADAGVFTLTAQDVGLLATRTMPAAAAAFAFTGQDVGLLATRHVLADAAAYVLTAQDVALSVSMPAEVAAFVLTGQTVGLRATRFISAGAAAFVWTGRDVSLRKGRRMEAGAATYVLTGNAVRLLQSHLLSVEHAVFVVSGRRAVLVYRDYGPEARAHAKALLTHLVEGRVTPYWSMSSRAQTIPTVRTTKRVSH